VVDHPRGTFWPNLSTLPYNTFQFLKFDNAQKIKSAKLLLLRFKHVCEKHTEKKETKGQYYDQKKLRVVKKQT